MTCTTCNDVGWTETGPCRDCDGQGNPTRNRPMSTDRERLAEIKARHLKEWGSFVPEACDTCWLISFAEAALEREAKFLAWVGAPDFVAFEQSLKPGIEAHVGTVYVVEDDHD